MRIAFVNQPRDYMLASGAQRGSVSIVTWELARRLAAQHEVVVYAPCAPGQAFEERATNNLLFRRTPRALRNLHRSLDLTLVIVSHDLRAIASGCTRVACLNQTIHYHDSPAGLTEDVLREVFQHEVSWALRRKASDARTPV